MLIRDRDVTDATLQKALDDRGFLGAEAATLGFLRQEIPDAPAGFDPNNRLHRPSMRFLREQKVYEMFFQTPAVLEAQDYLTQQNKRMAVEQVILARLDYKVVATKLNKKHNWKLTADGISSYRHYFWNLDLLTFDQWGRYLYERSALYDRYMAMLQSDPRLAFFHLKIDQTVESKTMLKRAQDIAYFALEEVNQVPGVRADKVKSIGTLIRAMTECHNALSTSDMALTGVLKEFEKWRMTNPQTLPLAIQQIAPAGNFTGSGVELRLLDGGQTVDAEVVQTPNEEE